MVWLYDGENKFADMFIHFDRMHESDGHTQTHTHTPHDSIGRACIASRGKNFPLKGAWSELRDPF